MVFGIEREIMTLDQFRTDLSDPEALEQWDQSQIHLHGGAKNHGFGGSAYRVLDLVGPDVLHRLYCNNVSVFLSVRKVFICLP